MLISPVRCVDRRVASGPVRRIGITASRKVGGAVARNRVKRAIREWFRHSRENLPADVDVVVIARPGAAALSGSELASGLSRLVEQASHD
jgi:ribonuclease P protein component